MAKIDFDATQYDGEVGNDFHPLPAGWYTVRIIDSEMKPTKDGTGAYLELTMEVLDEKYKGRRLWDRLNLKNRNEIAVNIAKRQLAGYCHAIGVLKLSDTTELHGKPFRVNVIVKKDPQYGDKNEIRGMEKLEQAVTSVSETPTSGSTNTGASSTSSTPPWL